MANEDKKDYSDKRLQAEWVSVNSIREMLQFSTKRMQVTYADAIALAYELLPSLFTPDESLLLLEHEPQTVREIRELTEARTEQLGKKVTPLDVIKENLNELDRLLKSEKNRLELQRRRLRYERLWAYFHDRKSYTEHRIIETDGLKAQVSGVVDGPIFTDSGREFLLPFNRYLRVRILHPDRPEQISGADLIYEVYSPDSKKARIVAVQYKIWDGERLYFSQTPNLENQLTRLQEYFCGGIFCFSGKCESPRKQYRMPYCTAFLRPTDRLQSRDARLISTGYHIPVCKISTLKRTTQQSEKCLDRNDLWGTSLTPRPFQELFNKGMVGSIEVPVKDLDEFYRNISLFDERDSVIIHAQEFTAKSQTGS